MIEIKSKLYHIFDIDNSLKHQKFNIHLTSNSMFLIKSFQSKRKCMIFKFKLRCMKGIYKIAHSDILFYNTYNINCSFFRYYRYARSGMTEAL